MNTIESDINQNSNFPPPETKEAEGSSWGHHFKVFNEKVKDFFIHVFHAIGETFSKRSSLGKLVKFSINILTGVGHTVGGVFRGAGLLPVLQLTEGCFDALDILGDIDHFANDRYKKDGVNHWCLTASIGFFIADVGGLFLWLDDLALISLSKVGATIGNGFSRLASALGKGFTESASTALKACPLLAKIAARITLVNVVQGVVGGAYFLLVIDESLKLVRVIDEKNIQEIVNCAFYLASYITEVALKILVIVGFTNVYGLVALGCLATGLYLTGTIIGIIREFREERAREELEASLSQLRETL